MASVPDPDNILRSLRMDLASQQNSKTISIGSAVPGRGVCPPRVYKIRIGGAWAGVYILVVVRFLAPRELKPVSYTHLTLTTNREV